MYMTNLDNLFDKFFEKGSYPKWNTTSTAFNYTSEYDVKKLEDGRQQLTLNVLGHNPKNIKLEVTEDQINIKSEKEEGSSPLVENVDLSFTLGKDYDGTKTEAKFSNGLLILTIDKKEERKSKSISIKVA